MILIITHKEDYTADYIVDKLNILNINYLRLNCEDLFLNDFEIDSNLHFYFKNQSEIKSIWFRRTKLPNFDSVPVEFQNFLLSEYDCFLKNIFEIMDAKWLSKPYNIYRAENKLYQLKLAKEIGFTIPKTLVTNNKEKIKDFYYESNSRIVLKPFYSSKVFHNNKSKFLFTNILKEEHLLNLEQFDLTPTIFQQYIEKEKEFRITVVGQNVFVASVNSQSNVKTKVDWRKDDLKFSKDILPPEIESKSIQMVKDLGLLFGAIDIIKGKDGEYYFLEINPNGQWVWIEVDTGLKISEAIINELTEVY